MPTSVFVLWTASFIIDVVTLDNPVNGSSPALRTDYTGRKTKGRLFPILSFFILCNLCWPVEFQNKHFSNVFLIQISRTSVASLVKTWPACLRSSRDLVWLLSNCQTSSTKWWVLETAVLRMCCLFVSLSTSLFNCWATWATFTSFSVPYLNLIQIKMISRYSFCHSYASLSTCHPQCSRSAKT